MAGVALKPHRLSHRAVLNNLIEGYQARVAELERINKALQASWEERGKVIKEIARAKD